MKRWLWLGLACVAATANAAEENFSSAVRLQDFSAAGLTKLSPAELARLDALVRDYKSGALATARQEAEAAAQAGAAAEMRAAQAEADARAAQANAAQSNAARENAVAAAARTEAAAEKKNQPGLLAKAKVLLTPGTQVEYASVEDRIQGDFRGWEAHTVFTLENGSRWQVLNGSSYVMPAVAGPKVRIVPASTGGFWMTIEGVSQRVRVAPFGVGR